MTAPDPAEDLAHGDPVAALNAVRVVLADAITAAPPARDLAALTRRLLDVLAALDAAGAFLHDDDLARLLSTPTRTEEP